MESDSPKLPEEPGKLIAGRYRLGRSLGQGTFGQVFYAEDIKFDPPRAVAVKVLHSQFLSDAQSREDIRREASVLARFHHPNILRVSDFEISSEMAYIVTDFAEGGSLAKKLRPEAGAPPVALPLAEVVYYLEQIASALDEAHNLGLIHRDIKPLNILLDRGGRPLLADFGLATALSGSASSMLVDLSASGTPLYMAPEQWAGKAGKASDIYALGVVTYQLITGQPPFQGNQAALWAQHTGAPIPALHERAPWLDYPPALDAVIAGAMAKDDRERTRPAGEIARRFKTALMGSPAAQFNYRNQPPAVFQPGPGAASLGIDPSVSGANQPLPGTTPSNTPSSFPTVVSINNGPAPGPPSSSIFQTHNNLTGAPAAQSQPQTGSGAVPPWSQSQQPTRPGSLIQSASQVQPWTPNGPVPPPAAWPNMTTPPVTKKRSGLNPVLLLGLGLLFLLVIGGASVLFLLPKNNSGVSNPAAVNATGTAGTTAAGTPGTTQLIANNNAGTPGPTLDGPAATSAAKAGAGQLEVEVTESNGKPARENDLTIRVFKQGATANPVETIYSKAQTTIDLKAGAYQVEVLYLNDVRVMSPVVEIKEGQPTRQAINLGLGQVQVEVLEAAAKTARDNEVTLRVFKDGDTSKPVVTVYSHARTNIYLRPGSYQLETEYTNEVKVAGPTFQVTEGQVTNQSINLQVGQVQLEIYETTGRLARENDIVIRVSKEDDPNVKVTTVYGKAKPAIVLKEGTYIVEVGYADTVKVTSGPVEIKAGQTARQTVNLQVGTVQVEVKPADGSKINEADIVIKVFEQGNPNDIISTSYSKAKASFTLQPGFYVIEVTYSNNKKVTGPALEVKEGQTATQVIQV